MRENRIATERRRIAEEEAKRKREAAEAEAQRLKAEQEVLRKAEQARVDDLEERLRCWHQSWAIRDFIDLVEADARQRGISIDSGSPTAEWLAWANARVNSLAKRSVEAIGERHLTSPQKPTEPISPPSGPPSPHLMEVPPKSYWETRHWWQRR